MPIRPRRVAPHAAAADGDSREQRREHLAPHNAISGVPSVEEASELRIDKLLALSGRQVVPQRPDPVSLGLVFRLRPRAPQEELIEPLETSLHALAGPR